MKHKGKVSFIASLVLSILALILLGFTIYFITEHYKLQATATGLEGFGSVVLIIFSIIGGAISCLFSLISIIINIINIKKRTDYIKFISKILLGVNSFMIILNIVMLLILKFVQI